METPPFSAGDAPIHADVRQVVARIEHASGASDPDVDAALQHVLGRLQQEENAGVQISTDPGGITPGSARNGEIRRMASPGARWLLGGICASVLAAGWIFWSQILSPHQPSQVTFEYATRSAQRMAIVFPDGSRALLAPASHVTYRYNTKGERLVTLNGQAYFTVAPDPEQPFLVRSSGVVSRVLGTSFDVRYYDGDGHVQVAVIDGKVAVATSSRQKSPLILTPGMVATTIPGDTAVVDSASAESVVAWRDGKLVFRRTPVSAVVQTLSRWYGYEFAIQDSSLAEQRVTTVFTTSDFPRTLATLRDLLDVNVGRRGNVIVLSPLSAQQRLDRRCRLGSSSPECRIRDQSLTSGVGK